MQSVFVSISFRRCGGSTSPSAACSDATATTPVVPTSAPFSVVSGGVASLLVLAVVGALLPELRRYRTDGATA